MTLYTTAKRQHIKKRKDCLYFQGTIQNIAFLPAQLTSKVVFLDYCIYCSVPRSRNSPPQSFIHLTPSCGLLAILEDTPHKMPSPCINEFKKIWGHGALNLTFLFISAVLKAPMVTLSFNFPSVSSALFPNLFR